MIEEIIAIARAFSAASEGEEPALKLLCAAAEQELAAALGTERKPADCYEAFVCAAGCLAAAGMLAGRAGTVEKFTVGEVSVSNSNSGGGDRAEALRRQAQLLMAPYTGGSRFAFRGVTG